MSSKSLPVEIDEYFLIDVILIFLMINYNMPLSTIYISMVIIGSLMYLVPVQHNLFRWIPLAHRGGGNLLTKIAVGVGFGVGFIYVYNMFAQTPMATIFATTLFGSSELLTILIYSLLIPLVETRFFFRTIMQWWAYKSRENVNAGPLSSSGVKLMLMFGAVFTLFHATAKGIDNHADLAITLVFGILSVGMILYFKEYIQAAVMHIVVNAKAMGMFDSLQSMFNTSRTWVTVVAVLVLMFWLSNGKSMRLKTRS